MYNKSNLTSKPKAALIQIILSQQEQLNTFSDLGEIQMITKSHLKKVLINWRNNLVRALKFNAESPAMTVDEALEEIFNPNRKEECL